MSTPAATIGVILAAGKGTRMKSDLPKCLHRVCGLPLAEHVGRALRSAGIARPIVVIGHGGDAMQEALGDSYDFVWQREQLGTGHAVMQAAQVFAGHSGPVLITQGDAPLLTPELLADLVERHRNSRAACTLATSILDDATGYGRIIRGAAGRVERVAEQRDATPEERAIREVNAGVYVFDASVLVEILPTLSTQNAQGEYYLTDAVQAISDAGMAVAAAEFDDPRLFYGVNDRWQLAEADRLMRERLLRKLAIAGVTLLDPSAVYIDADVQVGKDTVIEPGTHLHGGTKVGERCKIGPNTQVLDCEIGDDTSVLMSHLKGARIGRGVRLGPFANIRPGTTIGDACKIGNFVEVKNATLGDCVSAGHLTYIGDASVGPQSNIGAGTITCNYDGYAKHHTEIGAGVFVGSNSTLIAPVTISDDAFVAAGSVVTHDVPADALAVGRARQENKEGWVRQWRKRKTK